MAEIKTRILLRNDTLANWEAAGSVSLRKGEVGIAMLDGALAEVRIGGAADGSNTSWANSRKLRVEATQISGLIDTINTQISGIAQEYSLSAGTGDDANKWFLQYRPLSGGDWATASTLDLTQLTGYALSTDVDALVAAVSAETLTSANAYTDTTVDAVSVALSTDYVGKIGDLETSMTTLVGEVSAETLVSANAYTDAEIDALSIDNYMLTADFNALSNEIGLSAASSSNPIVTKNDIADLAGAMHFRGAVTPNEGETDAEALARTIEDPASGDVAIITTTSKEYVYNGTTWIELGDEVLYATKAEVSTVSAALSTDYVGKIGDLSTATDTLVGTVSAETLVSANAYADSIVEAATEDLSNAISSKIWFQEGLTATGEHGDLSVVKVTDADLPDYAAALDAGTLDDNTIYVLDLSAQNAFGQKIENVAAGTVSSDAATYGQLTATASDLCSAANATIGTVSAETLVSANAYTDEQIAALSIGAYALSSDVDSLVNATSVALSTDYVGKIGDLSTATDTLVGTVSAETLVSANAYTDEQIAALSIDDYIKHGEVTSDDLSGYFVLDCGSATYRSGEQAATEA